MAALEQVEQAALQSPPVPDIAAILAEKEQYIAAILAEKEQLRQDYDRVVEESDRIKRQLYILKQWRLWEKQLDKVEQDKASVSHKATIRATLDYIRNQPKEAQDTDGYTKMNAWKVGKMGAQEHQTVRDNWGYCSTGDSVWRGKIISSEGPLPLFDKKIIKVPDRRKPKGFRFETWMKEREIVYHPQAYKDILQTPRKHGGAPICEDCGVGEIIVEDVPITKQERRTCNHCGTTRIFPPRKVNDPLPYDGQEQPPLDIMEWAEEILSSLPEENVQSQVDLIQSDTYKVNLTVGGGGDVQGQVDFIAPQQDESSNPPPATIDARATLTSFLEKHRGPGRIIVATRILEPVKDKYRSKAEGYVPDVMKYLEGDPDHIYGSRALGKLVFDFDDKHPEHDRDHLLYMNALAEEGIASIYFSRRPGRGHLEIPFDESSDPQAAYRWIIGIVPELATVPEVYPVKGIEDKRNCPISWPFWQRIGDQVTECRVEAISPELGKMDCKGIASDPEGLARIVESCVTPAALVPDLQDDKIEPTHEAVSDGGGLLESPVSHTPPRPLIDTFDVLQSALDEFNRNHTWRQIANLCGGMQKDGAFLAVWRNERTASVKVNKNKSGLATDWGHHDPRYPKQMDKHTIWCLAQGINPKEDRARLCAEYRERRVVA